jgi:virginiamycin B lyase
VDFTVDLKNGLPGSIAVGPDGNIWFTSPQEGLIRSITTSGKLTKVRIPAETPAGIALGPDGAVWFTEQPNGIGRIEVPKRRG